ncbi:MAG: heparan-alpha-glucosaminide N-acetyltransferase domain-containing protein [Corynebacterium flavescens]|uniref:DUF418 domain-containing protein n=1 Tax=Corynebacterium flavescens TaxID=28028 RepID=UPI0026489B53|nr:heparan-alpha-glucosaminide N-acetyltransferase domain-containing protein [Corynebacterium flavescens]MDN6098712.1 heparan-alpha-glucosaminide N-acetyltransferase domain-containing protein [Corynebacterium flavescens]
MNDLFDGFDGSSEDSRKKIRESKFVNAPGIGADEAAQVVPSSLLVPEGDLPPGIRPQPGRRKSFRKIWTGDPAADATEETVFNGRFIKGRITGFDAARGFALIGMVAVHTLPSWSPQNYEPTLTWILFAGHSAALFAVLAGVSLALISGGKSPHTGRRLRRDRVQIVVRALLILVIGMTINFINIPAFNILQYYGLMFLFAVPFLRLSVRKLLLASFLTAVVGPAAAFFVNANLDYEVIYNATPLDLLVDPFDTFWTLLVGGTYPVVTWMAFVFLGMAVGRMDLSVLRVQIRLGTAGALCAFISSLSADILLNFLGGWDRLLQRTPDLTGSDLLDILDYGPQDNSFMPTSTLWWLTVNAPHADTFFSLTKSAGLALVAICVFLVWSRANPGILLPLMNAGAMTFTLYVAHLIVLSTIDTARFPGLWFAIQISVMLVFAYFWSQAQQRGPVESIISWTTKSAGKAFVPDKAAPGPEPEVPKQKKGSRGGKHHR